MGSIELLESLPPAFLDSFDVAFANRKVLLTNHLEILLIASYLEYLGSNRPLSRPHTSLSEQDPTS